MQLEHADQLLSALSSPLPPAAAAVTPLSPSAPHTRLHKFSSSPDSRLPSPTAAGATRPPPLVTTTPTAASRSSPHSPHTAGGSPTAAAASSSGAPDCSQPPLPLPALLLSKSLDVFFNTATALLQSHAPTAVQAAAGCETQAEWTASAACTALQLSVRCYRHCLQLASSPLWSMLPPALTDVAASKLMRAHLRAADGLILLHCCTREVTWRASPLPPLLRSPEDATLSAADSTDSDPATASVAGGFSLPLAVPHLRKLLALLHDSADTSAATATLRQAATVQLAWVLLRLGDAREALELLAPLLQNQPPVADVRSATVASGDGQHTPASASRRLHARLYAVEAHLQLQRPDTALGLLRECDAPCVRWALRTAGLDSASDPVTVQPDGADQARHAWPPGLTPTLAAAGPRPTAPPGLTLALHICTTLAFILLVQQRSDAAQRCVRMGLDLQPVHAPLLRLQLLLHLRDGARMPALWMLKRRLPDSPPLFTVT